MEWQNTKDKDITLNSAKGNRKMPTKERLLSSSNFLKGIDESQKVVEEYFQKHKIIIKLK